MDELSERLDEALSGRYVPEPNEGELRALVNLAGEVATLQLPGLDESTRRRLNARFERMLERERDPWWLGLAAWLGAGPAPRPFAQRLAAGLAVLSIGGGAASTAAGVSPIEAVAAVAEFTSSVVRNLDPRDSGGNLAVETPTAVGSPSGETSPSPTSEGTPSTETPQPGTPNPSGTPNPNTTATAPETAPADPTGTGTTAQTPGATGTPTPGTPTPEPGTPTPPVPTASATEDDDFETETPDNDVETETPDDGSDDNGGDIDRDDRTETGDDRDSDDDDDNSGQGGGGDS